MMHKFYQLMKEWKLPVAMILGVIGYFAFVSLPLDAEAHALAYHAVQGVIQPVLIFSMLFLSFCKVKIHDMLPRRWQIEVLVLQMSLFMLSSLGALMMEDEGSKVLFEGAMICFICPTATASAVIVGKLGGNVAGDVTYIMLCNLAVSLLGPAILPVVEPQAGMDFMAAFVRIISKVFPLLIMPLVCAWLVKKLLPRLHQFLLKFKDLAFYLWLCALALAIAVTVRSIVHTTVSVWYLLGLAIISLVACLLQFGLGKWIGSRYDEPGSDINRITAGQAFGQKNTAFVIWLGLVFLNPVTSVAGGFYSVWHNIVNSVQLHRKKTAGEAAGTVAQRW